MRSRQQRKRNVFEFPALLIIQGYLALGVPYGTVYGVKDFIKNWNLLYVYILGKMAFG